MQAKIGRVRITGLINMSMPVSGSLANKLIKTLRLPPHVTKLEIKLETGCLATASCTFLVEQEQSDQFAEIMRNYELTEIVPKENSAILEP